MPEGVLIAEEGEVDGGTGMCYMNEELKEVLKVAGGSCCEVKEFCREKQMEEGC